MSLVSQYPDTPYRSLKQQAGFTLIEVLITVLILAVGLLSIAALQFKGMQYNEDAEMRSNMSILAYDIFDRMRLNTSDIGSYIDNFSVPTSCTGNIDCDPTTCNATTVTAANDLICWHAEVFNSLPPGTNANITRSGTATAGYEYSVQFLWTGRDGENRTSNYTIFHKS